VCVNYTPLSKNAFDEHFNIPPPPGDWLPETWQDYAAPIIRPDTDGQPQAILAAYSMVPKQHIPPGVKRFSTMNARSETIGQLRSFAKYWNAAQLCLVPMTGFFEPNWETGKAIRYRIGMRDGAPFAVAGLWREWSEPDGQPSYSFTQLTVNADDHPLMSHFHRPGDEKRSLVIIPPAEYDAWLGCKNPEIARTFLKNFPAELMSAIPAPLPPRKPKPEAPSLF